VLARQKELQTSMSSLLKGAGVTDQQLAILGQA
jgi:hypothetical protein